MMKRHVITSHLMQKPSSTIVPHRQAVLCMCGVCGVCGVCVCDRPPGTRLLDGPTTVYSVRPASTRQVAAQGDSMASSGVRIISAVQRRAQFVPTAQFVPGAAHNYHTHVSWYHGTDGRAAPPPRAAEQQKNFSTCVALAVCTTPRNPSEKTRTIACPIK